MGKLKGRLCSIFYCRDKHWSGDLCHRHIMSLRRYNSVVSPKDKDVIALLSVIDSMKTIIKKSLPFMPLYLQKDAEEILSSVENKTKFNVT